MTFTEDAWFIDATLSREAWFGDATFMKDAFFERASFRAYAWFDSATFNGYASFDGVTFDGFASFSKAKFKEVASFAAVHAERGFTLAEAQFGQVPDFIQAHFEEAPRLDNVSIPEVEGIRRFLLPNLSDVEAGAETPARYRALKRLAIEAHDHTREQDFFASELKALRGNPDRLIPCPLNLVRKDEEGERLVMWPGGLRGTGRYWMGLFYEVLSNFGRSMVLPLVWLLIATVGFAWLYKREHASVAGRFASHCIVGQDDPCIAALNLSIRKALPFAGVASSEKLNQIYACLYGIHGNYSPGDPLPERFAPVIPNLVDFIGIGQLLLSLVLIFLFLLAVRNHFRIR